MNKYFFVFCILAFLGSTVHAADLSGTYQTNGCVNYEGKDNTIWSWIASINLSPNGKITLNEQVFEGSDCRTPYFANTKYGTYVITGNNIRFTMTKSQFEALSIAEELKSIPPNSNEVTDGYLLFDTAFIASDRIVFINLDGFLLTKIKVTQR